MGFLEPIIRTIKKKLIQYLRKEPAKNVYSEKLLTKYLRQVVTSYNDTINRAHGQRPSTVNSPIYDPWLRAKQFPTMPLIPFDEFYAQELRRQKIATTPNPKARNRMDENINNYRVGDEVYLDYLPNAVGVYQFLFNNILQHQN